MSDEAILVSRLKAAKLLGVCPKTFDVLVRAKAVPGPVRLPIRRKLWHRGALDSALAKGLESPDDWKAREAAWKRRKDRPADAG